MRFHIAVLFACSLFGTSVQAGFFEQLRDAATAPIRAPANAVQDIARGRPPSEIVQNQMNMQVGAPAVAAGTGLQLIQRGYEFIQSIPRDFIRSSLGEDWLRGYDRLAASQRVQQEMSFTMGRYLAHCAANRQCSPEQAAAMPVAAALRDAYKTYITYSIPLPPQFEALLGRAVPPRVLGVARWAVGNAPDFSLPGYLNSSHTAYGQAHAVTVGNVMIFSRMPNLANADDVIWFLHELSHIEQYMSYSDNWLEAIDGLSIDYILNYSTLEKHAQDSALERYKTLSSFAQQQ